MRVPRRPRAPAAARTARRSRRRCSPGSAAAASGRAGTRTGRAAATGTRRCSSRPQVGQWCEAKTTSVSSPNSSIASLRYCAQPVRVAHQGAAQREQVVQGVRGVLRHAQRAAVREVEVHLGRRLGARRHLEHDPHAVDRRAPRPVVVMSTVGGDQRRRRRSRWSGRARRRRCPRGPRGRRRRTCSPRGGPSRCRRRRSRRRVLEEALRGDDRDSPASTSSCVDDTLHAAEVVDVAVRVDHRHDRPVAAVLAVERERGGGGLGRDQRIDDDQPRVALDERDVREVEAAHLVDAVGDLEQAVVGDELRLPPEARVRGGGASSFRNA